MTKREAFLEMLPWELKAKIAALGPDPAKWPTVSAETLNELIDAAAKLALAPVPDDATIEHAEVRQLASKSAMEALALLMTTAARGPETAERMLSLLRACIVERMQAMGYGPSTPEERALIESSRRVLAEQLIEEGAVFLEDTGQHD